MIWVVRPLVGHEPRHTQHHEGNQHEDGDSHLALREVAALSPGLPVRQVLSLQFTVELSERPEESATFYVCVGSVCRTGYPCNICY